MGRMRDMRRVGCRLEWSTMLSALSPSCDSLSRQCPTNLKHSAKIPKLVMQRHESNGNFVNKELATRRAPSSLASTLQGCSAHGIDFACTLLTDTSLASRYLAWPGQLLEGVVTLRRAGWSGGCWMTRPLCTHEGTVRSPRGVLLREATGQ